MPLGYQISGQRFKRVSLHYNGFGLQIRIGHAASRFCRANFRRTAKVGLAGAGIGRWARRRGRA